MVKTQTKHIQILISKRIIRNVAKNAACSSSPYFEIKFILSNKTHLLSLSCYFYNFIESLSLLPHHFSLIHSSQVALSQDCRNEGQLLQQIYFLSGEFRAICDAREHNFTYIVWTLRLNFQLINYSV